jgi:uncharacterized phage infection (PIP) family protein YhgE
MTFLAFSDLPLTHYIQFGKKYLKDEEVLKGSDYKLNCESLFQQWYQQGKTLRAHLNKDRIQAEVNSLYQIYNSYSGKGEPFLLELIGTRVKQLELAELHELDDNVVEASIGMYDALMDGYRTKKEQLKTIQATLKQRDREAYQHRLNQLKDRENQLHQRENQLQQRESRHAEEMASAVRPTSDNSAQGLNNNKLS